MDLALLHTLEHASRIHDVKFAQRVNGEGEVVLVAAEDKKTTVYEVNPDSGTFFRPIAHLVGHGNRVKALDTIKIALSSTMRRSTTLLSSVSSDGTINVYDLSLLPPPSLSEEIDIVETSPVVTYDSKGSRLTCVTLADGDVDHLGQLEHKKGVKRERQWEEEDDKWEGFEIT